MQVQRTRFPDLYNYDTNLEENHVWSSFTDVMILIVIIFLIILSVSTLRNFSLIEKLEISSLSEQKAREKIQQFTVQQSRLEQDRQELERQLLQSQSELTVAQSLLEDEGQKTNRMDLEIKALRAALTERELELRDESKLAQKLSESLDAQKKILQSLELALSLTEAELQQKNLSLQETEAQVSELAPALQDELQKRALTQQQLDQMQQELSELQLRYDRLVRPARTDANKYVVSIRYFKLDQRYIIELEEKLGSGFKRVTTAQLHASLRALKEEHADDLYTRIIIPENSNLNFNEAWNFQLDVLNRYDYYYQ